MIVAELVAILSRIDPTTEVLVAAPGDPTDPPCAGFVYVDRSTLTRPVIMLTGDANDPELQGRPGDLDDDVRPWSDRGPTVRQYRRAAGTAERADARRRQVPGVPGKCPDEGTCHHQCGDGSCFRVPHCAPLSGYGETWPADVRAAHAAPNPAWRW